MLLSGLGMLLSIFDIFDILIDETTDDRQTDRHTKGHLGPARAGQ